MIRSTLTTTAKRIRTKRRINNNNIKNSLIIQRNYHKTTTSPLLNTHKITTKTTATTTANTNNNKARRTITTTGGSVLDTASGKTTTTIGNITIRKFQQEDSQAVAQILFDAFNHFAKSVSAPPEFASVEEAAMFPYYALQTGAYQFVVGYPKNTKGESKDIIGCMFLRVQDATGCMGPLAVSPSAQEKGIGKALMKFMSDLAIELKIERRFTQNSSNIKSLGIYIDLGFQIKEPFLAIHGKYTGPVVPSKYQITEMKMEEIPEADKIHRSILGITRAEDYAFAIGAGGLPMSSVKPLVVRDKGKMVGVFTGFCVFSSGVATDEQIAKEMVIYASTRDQMPANMIKWNVLPMKNPQLLKWALANGFKINFQGNLMGTDQFAPINTNAGVYLASGGF